MSDARDELELKAPVEDPSALEAALARAGADLVFRGEMLDRRFDRNGELAARDEVLRLRTYRGARSYGVLGWKGPASVRGGYKHRAECETRVDDPDAVLAIIERLGYETVMRIDRTIVEYRLGGAALRIEWYPAMDVLLEIEGRPAQIEGAIAATALRRDAFVPEGLPHFTALYERRTGLRARIAAE